MNTATTQSSRRGAAADGQPRTIVGQRVVSSPESRVIETVTEISERAARRLETHGAIPPCVRHEDEQ